VFDVLQIYAERDSDVLLSMSADSSCQGLRSFQDGPLTLQLTSGQYGIGVAKSNMMR
jgi:hypothetical protein